MKMDRRTFVGAAVGIAAAFISGDALAAPSKTPLERQHATREADLKQRDHALEDIRSAVSSNAPAFFSEKPEILERIQRPIHSRSSGQPYTRAHRRPVERTL